MYTICFFFVFKQKTAYEMRISDWSSDVCSSDLAVLADTLPCPFIDQGAQELLDEARKTFFSLGLGKRYIVESDGKCYLMSWLGDHANDALRLRSEERRGGKECVSRCRFRGSP